MFFLLMPQSTDRIDPGCPARRYPIVRDTNDAVLAAVQDALKKRKVPVEYLRYEDEGHGLENLKNQLDAYPKMVAFLDRYVKGRPAR